VKKRTLVSIICHPMKPSMTRHPWGILSTYAVQVSDTNEKLPAGAGATSLPDSIDAVQLSQKNRPLRIMKGQN
jgi:hypothetical protein